MDVRLPDGRIIANVPEGTTKAQLLAKLRENGIPLPDGLDQPKQADFIGGLKSGTARALGNVADTAEAFFDPASAATSSKERDKRLAQEYGTTLSLDRVKQAYQNSGIMSAGAEILSQLPGFAGEQLPTLAKTAAGAKAGALLGGLGGPLAPVTVPAGALLGGILAGATDFVAPNLAEQRDAGVSDSDLSLAKAGGTALGQGALSAAGSAATVGKTVLGKIIGSAAKEVPEEAAKTLAKESMLKSIAKGAPSGAAKSAAVETPTEVLQQALTFAQAGKDLTSDEALSAYAESAYGGLLGGALGAPGGVVDRRAAMDTGAAQVEGGSAPTEAERRKQNKLAQEKADEEQRLRDAAELKAKQDAEQVEKEQRMLDKQQQRAAQEELLSSIPKIQDPNELYALKTRFEAEDTPRAKAAVAAIKRREKQIVEEKLALAREGSGGKPPAPVEMSPKQKAREQKMAEASVFSKNEPVQMELRDTALLSPSPAKAQNVDVGNAEDDLEPRLRPKKDKRQLEIPFDKPRKASDVYKAALFQPSNFDSGLDPDKPITLADIARAIKVDMDSRPGRVNQVFGKTNLPKVLDSFVGKTPREVAAMGQPKGVPMSDIIFGELTKTVTDKETSDAGATTGVDNSTVGERPAADVGTDGEDVRAVDEQPRDQGPVPGQPAPGGLAVDGRDTGEPVGGTRPGASPLGAVDAIQKPSPAQVPARNEPQASQAVGEKIPREGRAPKEGKQKPQKEVEKFEPSSREAYDLDDKEVIAALKRVVKETPKDSAVAEDAQDNLDEFRQLVKAKNPTESQKNRMLKIRDNIQRYVRPGFESEVPDAEPLYRKEDGGAPKGVPPAVVKAIADDFSSAAKNAPKIKVVKGVDEVPKAVRDFAGDSIDAVRGFYMPKSDEVYLVADNTVDSRDAQITLMHEMVGHYGLRAVLGESYARVMKAAKGNRIVQKMLGDRDPTDTNVEETLAKLAEGFVDGTAPKPSRPLIKQLIEAIRKGLRALGLSISLSDNEVAGLLADSYAYVFEGKGTDNRSAPQEATVEPEVQFRKEPTDQTKADLAEVEEATGRTEPYYPQEKTVVDAAREYWDSGSKIDVLRNALVDQASSVARKFSDLYSKGFRDTFGNINPLGLYRQAQAAPQLIQSMLREGGLAYDAERGQYTTTEVVLDNPTSSLKPGTKVNANMILQTISSMANNLGIDPKSAELLVDSTLRGLRYRWMIDRNKEMSDLADKAEAEGKKRLASDLREKLYLLPENDLRSATREAELAERNIEKYDEIRQIRDIMNAVRVHAIKQAGEAGRLTPEQVKEWSQGMEYVPFDRVRENDEAQSRRKMVSRGLVAFSDVPSLRGSETREVGNIVNNYFNMLGWMSSQTMRNKAAVAVLEDMRLVDFASRVKDPKVANNENAVVRVFKDGESVYYELADPVDVAAFDSLPVTHGPIIKALQQSTRLLRTLVTAMPPFAVSQVIQDAQRAAINSGTSQPFKVMGRTLANFPTFLLYSALGKKHNLVKELEKVGIVGAYDLNVLNPTEEARIEAGLEKMPTWKSVVRALDKITATSDLAARAAVYQTILEESGQDKARAAVAARELINFRRRGASEIVSWGIAAIPFFNAYIQGMDVVYRSINGKDAPSGLEKNVARAKFMKSMAGAFAIGTAYALMMSGNDEYEEAEDYLKDRAWLLPGGVRIPMPAELGVVFKVLPERIVRYISREGTDEEQKMLTAMGEYLKQSVFNAYSSPNVTPQLARPLIEWVTNYSFFTGREIVPSSLENKEPFLQVGSSTSEPARIIGEQLGLSPMKVDNFIAGVFGMAGSMAMQFGDAMLTDRGDRPLYKMPFLSSFSYDPIGAKPRSEFYALSEKINRVKTTYDDLAKTDPEAAFDYLGKKNHMALYSAANWRDARLEQISKLRELKKFIESNKEMSGADKRQQLDSLRTMEKDLNQDVRSMAKYLDAN